MSLSCSSILPLTERERFIRALRERRVAGMRACLADLRTAIGGALKLIHIEQTVEIAADLPWARQAFDRGNGPPSREALAVDDFVVGAATLRQGERRPD